MESCGEPWIGYLPIITDSFVGIPVPPPPLHYRSIDSVKIYIDIEHPQRGDIEINLFSPFLTRSVLTLYVSSTIPMEDVSFVPHSYLTHAFKGETTQNAPSSWILQVKDWSRRGHLRKVSICVRGDTEQASEPLRSSSSSPPDISPPAAPIPPFHPLQTNVSATPVTPTSSIRDGTLMIVIWSSTLGALGVALVLFTISILALKNTIKKRK